ncbi:MAG TPA: PilW family protein [Thermoanaerobaculia bacterium]|nr:PilW family protein [Thermoanaerobaculia bacterium]
MNNSRERGFTLVELSISLLVTIVLILGVLALFDFASRLSRVQTNVSDMQQSLRVSLQSAVRLVRMAGRGGLPLGTMPSGLGLAVSNNVPAGTRIGGPLTPLVLEGTDVVTVRGVFSTPLWQVNSADPASFILTAGVGGPVAGTIRIAPATPTGILQEREALRQAVENGAPEALVLVSPRDASIYAVVELDPATSIVAGPDGWTIGFRIAGGTHTAEYLPLSSGGGWPAGLTSAAFVGLLEEYRFYVRDIREGTDFAPRFSQARVFPGTQAPHRTDHELLPVLPEPEKHPSWSQDIADNVLDLQVALGFDSPLGGGAMSDDEGDSGDDDRIFESADGENDDWLYNDGQAFDPAPWNGRQLYFVRLSILARTDRRDPQHASPRVDRIEDHDLAANDLNQRTERMYRRRLLQTVIDMRNLG